MCGQHDVFTEAGPSAECLPVGLLPVLGAGHDHELAPTLRPNAVDDDALVLGLFGRFEL